MYDHSSSPPVVVMRHFVCFLHVLSQNALQFFILPRTIVADVGGMGNVVAIHAYFPHIMIIDELSTYMVD